MRSEEGVSAVEFALIAPILFVLTFGIIEFAVLLFDKAVVTNASREGARAAIVYNTDGSDYTPLSEEGVKMVVIDYANDYLVNIGQPDSNDLNADDIIVTYFDSSGNEVSEPESGGDVRVDVIFTYDFLVFPDIASLIGGTFDGTFDLVGTTVMRME